MTRYVRQIGLLALPTAVLAAAVFGCDGAQYHLALHYPDDAAWERAHRAELMVASGARCGILGSGQSVSDGDVVARLDFATDDPEPRIGQLRYGELTFFTQIRDVNCLAFLAGCVEQEIKPRADATVTIELVPRTEIGCATGTACQSGSCQTTTDASVGDSARLDANDSGQLDAAGADHNRPDSNAPDLVVVDSGPPGCWIDFTRYESGTVNHDNACQSCQPAESTAGWSAVTDGIGCGGNWSCLGGTCSNACGGTTVLADEPDTPCDFVGASDLDTCLDDVYACASPDSTECVNAGIDVDGDNYSVGDLSCHGDCGDSNSAVHFDATELCDGIDNNCDQQTDEGFGLCANCCDSSDRDLCDDDSIVCSSSLTTTYCGDPAGEMQRSKVEICGNFTDDNCNDQTDEGCGVGSWISETADSATQNVGKYPSIKVDASGGVHVSYYDQTNGHLKSAHRAPAGQWTVEIADATADRGQWTSLVLDSASTVHVVYYDATNGDLRYAQRPTAGGWSLALLDETGGSGRQASLAIDSNGRLYVTYLRDAAGIWWSEKTAGGSWQTPEQVSNLAGSDLKIRISVTEGIGFLRHVIYIQNREPFGAYLGSYYNCCESCSGCWSSGSGFVSRGSADFAAAFVDVADGWARWTVFSYDRAAGNLSELFLSSKLGGSGGGETPWPIDEAGDVGSHVSLARDALGNSNVAYYDTTNGDLKFAFGLSFSDWTVTTVDSAGDVGQFTDIAVDGSGTRHIVYYDVTNGNLKYASHAW